MSLNNNRYEFKYGDYVKWVSSGPPIIVGQIYGYSKFRKDSKVTYLIRTFTKSEFRVSENELTVLSNEEAMLYKLEN